MQKWKLIEEFLIRFIKEEITKTGLKRGICGLSGGIDSAVVAVLAKKALGENFKAFFLPSKYSSLSSIVDSTGWAFGGNGITFIDPSTNIYFPNVPNILYLFEPTLECLNNISTKCGIEVSVSKSRRISIIPMSSQQKPKVSGQSFVFKQHTT
jgi:hypothetical protein